MVETIERIETFLDDSALTCKLIFGIKGSDDKITLCHMTLDKDAIKAYRETFLEKVKKKKKMKHSEYNSSDYDPKEYATLKLLKIPNAREILKDSTQQANKLTKDFISNISFTVFRFQNKNKETAYFIRSYWRIELLAQGKINALLVNDGVLSLANKDIIIGSPTFECIAFDDELLIFKINAFEKIFQYKEAYTKHAQEVFNFLRTGCDYTIVGLDKIEEECTKLEDLRRISSINASPWYRSIDFPKLLEYSNRNKELGLIVNSEKKTIEFPNVKSFLMVFNEDYTHGPWSGRGLVIFRKKAFNPVSPGASSKTSTK